MPFNLLMQIIKDVSQWDVPLQEIIPVNYGELLCHKDWSWILQYITHHLPFTQIVLPTNGALLNNERVGVLCQIPTLKVINFSINAYFEETYEAFTGLKAENLQRIEQTIKQVQIERKDITLWASMVFDPEYQTDLERDLFIKHWREQGVTPQILPAASAGRVGKRPYNPVLSPCRSIFSDIVVGFDGKLSSCCFDSNFHLDLGQYSGNLLKDWKNAKLGHLRALHTSHRRMEVDLCRQCTFA